ncbi:hypothetical protein GGX14DRAFT_663408 [Mycena pura]|uniref:Uncharacterized protein n=1 Tax=Mycena pura TaxID=153505 RepID=A0AAD6YKU6_9AGAR|nr:hypothetical protein GGX14DRAFT_663408 [Mycena pura]
MVRQEYHNVLAAILWFLYRQSQVAKLKDDFPQDEQMDVDRGAEEDVDTSAEEDMDTSAEEDMDTSAKEEIPLCIPKDLPDISKEATLPNPFEHPLHGHIYKRGSALIITGFPGIGKTLFLSVIFYLRVAAKLPTAYMNNAENILVYDGHRLFVLNKPYLVILAVPKSAWILPDSNADFVAPPQGVAMSDRFFVQAASPRVGRTAWAEKITGSQFCLMQPWSLGELFTAYYVIPSEPCSAEDMQAFFNKFGGSARHVFDESDNLRSFDENVDKSARPLNNKVIYEVMTYTSPTAEVDDRVGHMLLSAFPLTDEDRTKFQMKSPTDYLEEKLLKQLNRTLIIALRKLYIVNVGVATPGCKATAADLLDKHHHGFIGLGGKWRLRKFTKVEGTSWQAFKDNSDWFLRADGKMTVSREVLVPRTRSQTRATKFKRLTMVNFPSANVKQLQLNYYYCPTDTTFDSCYMDRKGHGITFQVTESDNSHSLKTGGRAWLEERGITKFTYILVSGPKMGDPPSLTVPPDQEEKFDRFYHLVLDYPGLKELLLAPAD